MLKSERTLNVLRRKLRRILTVNMLKRDKRDRMLPNVRLTYKRNSRSPLRERSDLNEDIQIQTPHIKIYLKKTI